MRALRVHGAWSRWIVMTLAAGCAVAAVSTIGSSPAVGTSQPASGRGVGASSLRHNFAVFKRARLAAAGSAAVPAAVAQRWAAPLFANLGLDVADATEVTLNSTTTAWVVPGSAGACVAWITTSPGLSDGNACGPTSDVNAGDLFNIDGSSVGPRPTAGQALTGAEIAVGLAPNGNRDVSVVASDGTTQLVPVINNVWVWSSTAGTPSSISVVASSGTTETYGQ
jgi:hypothetical protein